MNRKRSNGRSQKGVFVYNNKSGQTLMRFQIRTEEPMIGTRWMYMFMRHGTAFKRETEYVWHTHISLCLASVNESSRNDNNKNITVLFFGYVCDDETHTAAPITNVFWLCVGNRKLYTHSNMHRCSCRMYHTRMNVLPSLSLSRSLDSTLNIFHSSLSWHSE